MNAGKAASQAGHAFLGSFFSAQSLTPSVAAEYAALTPGTKVVLQASLSKIELLADKLSFLGIPHFLVIDQGCEDFFGGQPVGLQ
jgi:peptidyl-tRNA hydrolase